VIHGHTCTPPHQQNSALRIASAREQLLATMQAETAEAFEKLAREFDPLIEECNQMLEAELKRLPPDDPLHDALAKAHVGAARHHLLTLAEMENKSKLQ
jgi:hypothetical protein